MQHVEGGVKTLKNDTKEMIRQAAVSEFMDKGFAGASLRQIVKNAGVTTGAFYKYYPTKEALFAELVEEHAEHIYNIYDEILADFEELSPEAQTARMKETSRLCRCRRLYHPELRIVSCGNGNEIPSSLKVA